MPTITEAVALEERAARSPSGIAQVIAGPDTTEVYPAVATIKQQAHGLAVLMHQAQTSADVIWQPVADCQRVFRPGQLDRGRAATPLTLGLKPQRWLRAAMMPCAKPTQSDLASAFSVVHIAIADLDPALVFASRRRIEQRRSRRAGKGDLNDG